MAPKRGELFRNKLPANILLCICSWDDMTAADIADELQTQRSNVFRALCLLRSYGMVERQIPRKWHQFIKPTEKGRDAVAKLLADQRGHQP